MTLIIFKYLYFIWNLNRVDEEDESIRMYLKLSKASAVYQQGKGVLLESAELQKAIDWKRQHNPTPAWGIQFNPALFMISQQQLTLLQTVRRRMEGVGPWRTPASPQRLRASPIACCDPGSLPCTRLDRIEVRNLEV